MRSKDLLAGGLFALVAAVAQLPAWWLFWSSLHAIRQQGEVTDLSSVSVDWWEVLGIWGAITVVAFILGAVVRASGALGAPAVDRK